MIGKKASIILYDMMILLPYAWIVVCAIFGLIPWACIFAFVALPEAIANCRQMHRFNEAEDAINNLDEKTAQLQLVHALVLTITLIMSVIIEKIIL